MIKLKKKKIIILSKKNNLKLCRLYNLKMCSKNYLNWLNDKNTNKFLEIRFKKNELKNIKLDIIKWFNSNNNLLMGIYTKISTNNYEHVGNIRAEINENHMFASIGIIIGETKYRNKKIATNAIKLFYKYLSEKLKIRRVCAAIMNINTHSIKAFKKAGFKIEAEFKKKRIYNQKRCNEFLLTKLN